MNFALLWRAYAICSFLGLGGYMYGYDNGILAICLVMSDFQRTFSFDSIRLSAAVVSVPLGAACISAILSGPIADIMGRKRFVSIACILHIIGTVIQLAGNKFASFFVGRIVAGIAIGMMSVICPLYQSEISLPEHRGRLISCHQFGVTLGFCIAFWIGYSVFNRNWRISIGLQFVAPVILLSGLYFIPESPRWLIYQGKCTEARDILQRLRAKKDKHDIELSMEYTGIIQERNYDIKYSSQSYAALIKKGIDNNRKRTILGVGLHIMTQLTGINAILFYLPYILESTGQAKVDSALLGNGISGMVNMLATIPTFFYIDKLGRRSIMKIGGVAMATCMIIIAAVQGSYSEHLSSNPKQIFAGSVVPITISINDEKASYVVLVFLCLFLACFALSWGSMGWIYPAEIYPQSIRAKGLGITTGASFATSIFVSQIATILFRDISWGTYLFFGTLCLVESYIIHKFYPETKGRSLEEIHLIFSGALIDKSAAAHHPQTAFEALSHLKQIHVENEQETSSTISSTTTILSTSHSRVK